MCGPVKSLPTTPPEAIRSPAAGPGELGLSHPWAKHPREQNSPTKARTQADDLQLPLLPPERGPPAAPSGASGPWSLTALLSTGQAFSHT